MLNGISREEMAQVAARELRDGYYVNLGIGIPMLVANYIPHDMDVLLQSENGILGLGPYPKKSEIDADLINAGKQTVSVIDGGAFVSSDDAFAMIRGGHIDLTIIGGMEVSERGDLANWLIPGKLVKGMGGAMDLVAGVKRIVVLMDHTNKKGEPKVVKLCHMPLTGKRVVNRIITNCAVIDVHDDGLWVQEIFNDISKEELQRYTEPELQFAC